MNPQTLCSLVFFFVLALSGAVAGADEAPPTAPEDDAAGRATKAGEERSTPEESKTTGPYKPFVPSESISGDSSVAFPVDI